MIECVTARVPGSSARLFPPVSSGVIAALCCLFLLAGCGGVGSDSALAEVPAEAALEPRDGTADGPHQEHGGNHNHNHGTHDHGGHDHGGDNHGGHNHGSSAPALAKDAELRIEHDARAGRILLTVGPFVLSSGAHEPVMLMPPLLRGSLPVSGWLVGFDVGVFDSRGTRLPQSLMHHSGLMLPDRRDLFLPIIHRLASAGEETDPIRLPWPLGVPITQGEAVLATAMLHNPTANDYGPVFLRFALQTAKTRLVEVRPFFMEVRPPPGPASWDLPPGRSTRSWEATPAVDGRIMGLGGHIHRHGVELVLEEVTTGRVLHRIQPDLEPDGGIRGIPQRYFLPFGIRVHRDRTYRITAVYDNPTGVTIPNGAMGSFGGVLIPARGTWPTPDPSDPLFQEDIEWYVELERAAAQQGNGQ